MLPVISTTQPAPTMMPADMVETIAVCLLSNVSPASKPIGPMLVRAQDRLQAGEIGYHPCRLRL